MGCCGSGWRFAATLEANWADFGLARDLGLPISIHAGMAGVPSAVHELNDLGLLDDDVNYAHGNEFTDAELRLIASSGCSIKVTPLSKCPWLWDSGSWTCISESPLESLRTLSPVREPTCSSDAHSLAAEESRANAQCSLLIATVCGATLGAGAAALLRDKLVG
jgi:cytosine/adenosine deaminase-related metal-dependent hydrolase